LRDTLVDESKATGSSVSDATTPVPSSGGYDPAYYEALAAVEDRHFWFRARNRILQTIIEQVSRGWPPGFRTLEVGCGTGNVLRVLDRACPTGKVIGMDLLREGLQVARTRTRGALVQGDVAWAPFRVPFQLIGMFDALEHVEDDTGALREVSTLLDRNGALVLTVPAHQFLWSSFDEASHHCRRYSLADLRRKLEATGYRVEYATQYMAPLFPLLWTTRRVAAIVGSRADHRARFEYELKIVPVMNEALRRLLELETKIIARRLTLPFGTSLVAVARRTTK
jgi:SAM-dependent methyltransferase